MAGKQVKSNKVAKKSQPKVNKKIQKKVEEPKEETPVEQEVAEEQQDLEVPESSSSSESESESDSGSEEEHISDDDIESEDIYGLSDDEAETKSGHTINKKITKADSNKKSKKSKKSSDKTGIIYIGRLPSRFQESELKTYFSQFGDIINLRLSRNKKTGNSKHYGYIEFESFEVAKIASETMDNYLLFGHLIKCKVVEEVHKDLFKNGNKKFKIIPWKKISKDKYEKPKTKKEWEIIVKKFELSKKNKQEELKSKGIDFDFDFDLKNI
ncbi:unnamed protein product [Candida verbasci]|uniref:RRM domain-containing protein n=1 Tax=Candida verbasci TaxID=1227364 RepID=A0A9W4U0Z5_9ASCO|nr:unnamed protein product [Candida verbasci]